MFKCWKDNGVTYNRESYSHRRSKRSCCHQDDLIHTYLAEGWSSMQFPCQDLETGMRNGLVE
jgi:hypothetical protein